ncbi:L-aspartate oxidase [Methylophilaceae bacterium]|nr:L-aspartate oxidase [Methylophilaceae bacterium]
MLNFDVAIVGSGLAGLSTALKLADDKKIAIISKRTLSESSSQWAQGGIAASVSSVDSTDAHVNDTVVAGAGLCDESVTKFVTANSASALNWLTKMGVNFTKQANTSELHLTKEGGHSHRRIAHVADTTGSAIQSTLIEKVNNHPNITIFEDHIAVDLITNKKLNNIKTEQNICLGLYVLENTSGKVVTIQADVTVLATGGASKVYLYTTNPDVSTGDGISMAWRSGCRVANMEFVQFHPTCLFHPHEKSFLISEVLRGEGGILKLPNNKPFMHLYDVRGDLAPRDVVARAIDFEMKKRGIECVYLDISHKSKKFIMEHFPMIYERCLSLNIDISKDPIPVVPAAHYSCGGVMTDFNAQTDVDNLYAVGEAAYTGLHGANRLASNSLLECLVFSDAAVSHILAKHKAHREILPRWDASRVTDADEEVLITHTWNELRRFMWNYVGIVRTNKRLSRAMHRIDMLRDEVNEFYTNFKISNNLIELRNLLQVAELIVKSAISRKESRGLHFSKDFPETSNKKYITILEPANFVGAIEKKHTIKKEKSTSIG